MEDFGGIAKKSQKGSDRPDPKAGDATADNAFQTSDLAEQKVSYPVSIGGRPLFVDPVNYVHNPAGLLYSLMQEANDTPDSISYRPVIIEFDANGVSNASVVNDDAVKVSLDRIDIASNLAPTFGIVVIAERKDTQLGTSIIKIATGAAPGDFATTHDFSVGSDEFKGHFLASKELGAVSLVDDVVETTIVDKEAILHSFGVTETANAAVRLLTPFSRACYGIMGQNVTVTVYPVPFTRNLSLQIEDAIASDSLESLSASILSQH